MFLIEKKRAGYATPPVLPPSLLASVHVAEPPPLNPSALGRPPPTNPFLGNTSNEGVYFQAAQSQPPQDPTAQLAQIQHLKQLVEQQQRQILQLQQQLSLSQPISLSNSQNSSTAPTLESFSQTLDSFNPDLVIRSVPDAESLCTKLKAKLGQAKQRMVTLQQTKLEELESTLLCPICMDQKKNVSCSPCGHALCRKCSDAILSANKKCPICRLDVRQINPIYL